MISIKSVAYLLITFAFLANAAVVKIEKRQLDSIINTVTSDVGSVLSQGTSVAASVFTDVTSVGGDVGTFVTSVGGHAATVITSAGGQAITLATSGVVTSFAGSQYTAVANAAMDAHSFSLSAALLTGLVTVLASICFGAWVAL